MFFEKEPLEKISKDLEEIKTSLSYLRHLEEIKHRLSSLGHLRYLKSIFYMQIISSAYTSPAIKKKCAKNIELPEELKGTTLLRDDFCK